MSYKITRTHEKTPKEADKQSQDESEAQPLYYVGIGASAGGLEALRPFVANLPESANMTYIVAQHMSPDHRSLMVELLGRETKLKVELLKTICYLPRTRCMWHLPIPMSPSAMASYA